MSEGKTKEMNDQPQFNEIPDALKCIGLGEADILEIYRIVSGVLAFGNVEFIDSGDTRGGWNILNISKSLKVI